MNGCESVTASTFVEISAIIKRFEVQYSRYSVVVSRRIREEGLKLAHKILHSCFHASGPGRPPRNPLGLFRTFIVMKMKGVRSLREMTRLLDVDPRLRKLCLIKKRETAYPRSVLSRFSRKVGEDKLNKIIWKPILE